RILEIFARPAHLVDEHHHWRGGGKLRGIEGGSQRRSVERPEPQRVMERPRLSPHGHGGGFAQRVARFRASLLQGDTPLVSDLITGTPTPAPPPRPRSGYPR